MDLSQRFIYLRKSCILLHTKKKKSFSGIGNSSKDEKTLYPKTEEWLLNLTAQPCFKLLGNDPHKSVSVVQRRRSKWCPCLGNSLWRLVLRAHRAARLGGKLDDAVTLPNLFLSEVWDVEQWEIQHTPLNLSIWASVCPGLCGYDQLCILKSIL